MPIEPNKSTGDFVTHDAPAHPQPKSDSEHPGYEIQDVNVFGIAYFLGGLAVSIVVFFALCFYIGKAINYSFVKEDGAPDKWHPYAAQHTQNREDLMPNTVMQQAELANLTKTFPTPRVVADDDNQETSDLHAREDLLLDNTSTDAVNGQTTLRIPIDQAMKLIVQRGLGSAPAAQQTTLMAGESRPVVTAPLTNGFARTGYELDQMQTRAQRMDFEHASEEGNKK